MRTLCPYSGLGEFHGELFKGETPVIYPHPMFSVPVRQLLARARRYGQGQYSASERKLLFLALLNSTKLVDFQVPADPTSSLVETYLPNAFKLVIWFSEMSPILEKLPRYRVTTTTADLMSIGTFFTAIHEARKEMMAPQSKKLLQELVEQRENVLNRAIHSVSKSKGPSFYQNLARWSIDVTEPPENKKDTWLHILSQHPEDRKAIFALNGNEARACYEFLTVNLTRSGSIGMTTGFNIAQEAMSHAERMSKLANGGHMVWMDEKYDGPTSTFTLRLDIANLEDAEEEVEKLRYELIAAGSPDTEPKKQDFDKLIDYIRVRAKWAACNSIREKLALAEKSLESKRRLAELHTNKLVVSQQQDEEVEEPDLPESELLDLDVDD